MIKNNVENNNLTCLIATFILNLKHKNWLNYEKFTKDASTSYELENYVIKMIFNLMKHLILQNT